MRSARQRVIAVAAAAIALALIPAGVAAAHGNPLRAHLRRATSALGCSVSLFAEPHLVYTGEAAQLFGILHCPALASNLDQPVTIYQHSAGTGGFKVIGTATSGAGGFYSLVTPPLATDSVFYAVSGIARSGLRTVRVAPLVTFNGPSPTSALLTGPHHPVTFTGAVSPAEAGAVIALQRENATSDEEWSTIQLGTVGRDGLYSITHEFVFPGDANLRVVVKARPHLNARGISSMLSYVISQPQRPALTIHTSSQIAAYGQQITISGVLAGDKVQTVALYSHPRGVTPFTKVAETTTNAAGEYSFSETALRNGPYRVVGPGNLTSAILFEGVRYVLSANASASSVPSGQAVTFYGDVTPALAGHVVYIERENNPRIGGFHVADVGTVEATGAFSITHYLFGVGKQVLRVRVPGDPENMAASSQTFTIEVTPAPAGSLRPVPPARQPIEGNL